MTNSKNDIVENGVCYDNITPPISLQTDSEQPNLILIDEICAECKNYFSTPQDRYFGTFKIENGALSPTGFAKPGQYYRIVGSAFNDGVYQELSSSLIDEEFDGAVWVMKIPPAFMTLVEEIKAYSENDFAKLSPYISESFGGYSYTKATNSKGVVTNWKDVFASKLNRWRRISTV